jgi:hypothetical protein
MTKNNSKKGVEHRVPKITISGSIGPRSPSKSLSKNPDITRTKIWTKKKTTITKINIENIVFQGDDFCDK